MAALLALAVAGMLSPAMVLADDEDEATHVVGYYDASGKLVKEVAIEHGDEIELEDIEATAATVSQSIELDANGGELADGAKSVLTVVTSSLPTWGWNTAEDGRGKWYQPGEKVSVEADLNLYQGVRDSNTTVTGDLLPAATRDGFLFAGWYDSQEGGELVGQAGESIASLLQVDDGDGMKSIAKLYARWDAIADETTANTADVAPGDLAMTGARLDVIPTVLLCVLFLGAGAASAAFWRKAKEENDE